jgi:hypothetical protein
MTEQELIDYLTANLSLQVNNTQDPFDWHNHFTVSLVLNGNVISSIELDVNDGQS